MTVVQMLGLKLHITASVELGFSAILFPDSCLNELLPRFSMGGDGKSGQGAG